MMFVRRRKTLSTEAYGMFVLLGREDFAIPITSAAGPDDTKVRSSGFELGLLGRRRQRPAAVTRAHARM